MTMAINMLVVDDVPANLVTLEALLDQPDYHLVTAPSGEKALECLLVRQDFALILMDVQMPGLNGFETVKMIKKNRRCNEIPVIFLTAISKETQYIDQGYDVGAIDYLTKPYNPAILQAKVAAFAAMYRTQQEMREEIARRKRTEFQLRLASEALDNTVESIMITDEKANIVSVNCAFERVTGYSKQEAVGNRPRMLQSGRHDQAFYRQLWQALQDKGVWQDKIWNRRKNGEVYPEHLSITAIRSDVGAVTHYVALFSDITHEISLEEQLLQSQKMEAIGTLVGGIAHDFNNMLGGMTGNLYLARKKAAAMPDVIGHLNNLDQLCQRSSEMISQLLTFARKGMVEMHDLSFTSFIEGMLKLVAVGLPENISFQQNYVGDDPLMVHADATQLQQVIMNLLNNARDAVLNAPEPKIDLRLSIYTASDAFLQQHTELTGRKFVHLSVRDNGCGIPKESLAHVFDPFFTSKEAGKGTGLGLAMCYGAIQSHHGMLNVESAVGRGTTFHVFLPLLDKETEHNGPFSQPSIMVGGDANGELILLADDSARVREPCAEFLKGLGYSVLEAEDGKQALALYVEHQDHIALALLDVVMPYLGGPPLAAKMREINPNLPVIFVTGYDRDSVMGNKHPLKNCEVLTKPYQYPHLGALVEQLIAQARC